MTPIVSARGLTKRYGRTLAVDHIDLDIPPGRIVGLVGPNGAGKTSALKAILGLATFDGELRVLGRNPARERAALMEKLQRRMAGPGGGVDSPGGLPGALGGGR